MLDAKTVDAYLERIGAKRPERPTTQALAHLHERHVLSVPFENIDFALGRPSPPVGLGEPALDKIIGQNRGGCCYELNGSFYELLLSLGFDAVPLARRVLEAGEFGPLLGHLTLGVQTEDEDGPWLADVGYGQGFGIPCSLPPALLEPDAQGTFELAETPLAIWTCCVTGSCSTDSNCGRVSSPTSLPWCGGSAALHNRRSWPARCARCPPPTDESLWPAAPSPAPWAGTRPSRN